MHIALIGGASTIGSTTAFALATATYAYDITLIDIAEDAAWAHATDLIHANYHATASPATSTSSGNATGDLSTIQERNTDELNGISPDAVVVCVGAPRSESETPGRGVRTQNMEAVFRIIDDVAVQLRELGPVPVIVVTNPIDRVTYRLWSELEWPREFFLGYSLSESARAAEGIARTIDVHPNTVECPTMGEHGEHVVPIFSKATAGGETVELTEPERAEITEYILDIPFEIAAHRGVGDSSRWVTSAGIRRLIETLRSGGSDRPYCLSVPLAGEYGLDEACLSIPVVLSGSGFSETIEWDLTDSELDLLREAHEVVQRDLREME